MSNIIIGENTNRVNRPSLRRSDHQPNFLEYIDTTLNESFSLNLTLTRTLTNVFDQYGNTILDQYLLYLLCQKIDPNHLDNLTNDFYQLLHQLLIYHGNISKSFFEYSTSFHNRTNYQIIFTSYTNFIWNEFDVNILLEIGCFLLKYRLYDIFLYNHNDNRRKNKNLIRQKYLGFFFEIFAIYYLSTYDLDFQNSRSIDMIFPSPSLNFLSKQISNNDKNEKFHKLLKSIHDNGELYFDVRQIKTCLQNDTYRFINNKLETKKLLFIKFFEKFIIYQQQNICRSLKSICRLNIKMQIKQYPTDIKQLCSSYITISEHLRNYLTYDNKFVFQSNV